MTSPTDARVRVVRGSDVDHVALSSLQRDVFGDVLAKNGIPADRLAPEVFAWKLAPPAGEARVAVVEEDGDLLAACVMFPVQLTRGANRVRGWHVCDAATAPRARGRGYCSEAVRTLVATVAPEEWAFAFPNRRSRGAFVREGFQATSRIPLWVRPVRRAMAAPEGVERVPELSRIAAELDDLAVRCAEASGLTAHRSAAYLLWRYAAHPYFDYEVHALRRDGELRGLLVLNCMRAREHVSAWVMECLAPREADRRELALAARSIAHARGAEVVLSMSNVRLPGAVRFPRWFLPKQHMLMARRGGDAAPASKADARAEWTVYTGDWDTF